MWRYTVSIEFEESICNLKGIDLCVSVSDMFVEWLYDWL